MVTLDQGDGVIMDGEPSWLRTARKEWEEMSDILPANRRFVLCIFLILFSWIVVLSIVDVSVNSYCVSMLKALLTSTL